MGDRLFQRLIGAVPQMVVPHDLTRPHRVPIDVSAAVVGAGIAGCAAAVVLAERGVRVTLLEAAPRLGGRAGAWSHELPDGTRHMIEHGFHAFFRQYYNLRALLRRVDPELGFLRRVPDYPIVSRRWPDESFARLPNVPPFGLLPLLLRSPSFRLGDLRAMDGAAALPLLAYDRESTYAAYDTSSAATLLDDLRLPERARAMLFDVFAHSFFNPEKEMSAAELIMMFHFYFLGNPEGLLFDVADRDYQRCIWGPLGEYLEALHVDVRTGCPVDRIEPTPHGEWRLITGRREAVLSPHVVLATDPAALQALAARSPGLLSAGRGLRRQIDSLSTTAPYAVARFWFDGDVSGHRLPFSGVTRESTLDSVAVYSRFEREAADWAATTGGSVVELHAYAAPAGVDATELAERMRVELAGVWPETARLNVIHVTSRVGADAPGFGLGSDATRPGVITDAPGVRLAGDWVRLGFPSALMERAAASGMLAAGDVLTAVGAAPEPVLSVPSRGLLARRARAAVQA